MVLFSLYFDNTSDWITVTLGKAKNNSDVKKGKNLAERQKNLKSSVESTKKQNKKQTGTTWPTQKSHRRETKLIRARPYIGSIFE